MVKDAERFCAIDDIPVRAVREADKEALRTIGKGAPAGGFYHIGGRTSCGRQFLTEDQTYTEGISDENPPREPQY